MYVHLLPPSHAKCCDAQVLVVHKVEKIMDLMRDADVKDGKFPTKWNMHTGRPSTGQCTGCICHNLSIMSLNDAERADRFSVGAFADSAHEYLLKQWLMTGKSENKAKDLCTCTFIPEEYPS